MSQEQEIDYFGHVYDLGQQVDFDGNVLLMIAKFMTEVIQKETQLFASFVYAEKCDEIKDDEGNLIRVVPHLKEHNKTSFMLTASGDYGAQLGLTSTGVKASQILSGLLGLHEKNIKSGLAKKQEEIDAKNAFKT